MQALTRVLKKKEIKKKKNTLIATIGKQGIGVNSQWFLWVIVSNFGGNRILKENTKCFVITFSNFWLGRWDTNMQHK